MKSLHFLYHELRPAKSRYSYVTPCEEFQAHCEFFSRLRGGGGQLRPEITFDDGHASDVRYALPMLERYGLRATFFITSGWTGTRAGYMDWSELRALQGAGHRIGAHGLTHTLLTACSGAELEAETGGARRRLEDGLGAEVRVMSLPGGRANGRVMRACYAAGFHQIFTSVPRAEEMDRTPRMVGRLNLRGGTNIGWIERVLDPATKELARVARMYRAKAGVQRLLGDRLYAALWALGNGQVYEGAHEGADVELPVR